MKKSNVLVIFIVSFIVIILLTIIVGAVGIIGVQQTSLDSSEMYYTLLKPLADMSFAQDYFRRINVNIRNVIIEADNPSAIASLAAEIEHDKGRFIHYIDEFRPFLIRPECIRAVSEVYRVFNDELRPGVVEIVATARDFQSGDSIFNDDITPGVVETRGFQSDDFVLELLEIIALAEDDISGRLEQLIEMNLTMMDDLEWALGHLNFTFGVVISVVLSVAVVVTMVIGVLLILYVLHKFKRLGA